MRIDRVYPFFLALEGNIHIETVETWLWNNVLTQDCRYVICCKSTDTKNIQWEFISLHYISLWIDYLYLILSSSALSPITVADFAQKDRRIIFQIIIIIKSSSNENPSIRSSSNGNNTSIKSSIKSFHQIHQSNLLWDNKSYQNKSSIKSATGPNQCSWPNPFAKAINLGGLGRTCLAGEGLG